MASLDFDEFARVQKLLVPSIVVLLREARERGSTDPRAAVKLMHGDADQRVRLWTRLNVEEGFIGYGDWCAMVDCAYLSL